MGVTDVIRGEDHISNTPRQILLYQALGWSPPRFAHLALVLGPDHAPLSKRHGATSVAEFRAKGYLPESLANYLALVGWSPGGGDELLPLDELARRFSLDGVSHSAGVFDEEKLAWANRHYLKAAPASTARDACAAVSARRGLRRRIRLLADSSTSKSILPIATGIDRSARPGARSIAARFSSSTAAAAARGRKCAPSSSNDATMAVARAFAEDLASSPRLIRQGSVSRRRAARSREDRTEGPRALSSDSRGADRRARRPGARPPGSGDRARRRAAADERHCANHRRPRARRCDSSRHWGSLTYVGPSFSSGTLDDHLRHQPGARGLEGRPRRSRERSAPGMTVGCSRC